MILTPEQEYDIVAWLKNNVCIFNKRISDYKNTELNNSLCSDNGDEPKVETPLLETLFESMKTRFGKLTKTQSADDAFENTDREKWIIDRFEVYH